MLDQEISQRNRMVAWMSFAMGVGSGLVLGLWSFDGPVPTPTFLGEYSDTSRRLARLGHIAFFGLGFLNLHFAYDLAHCQLTTRLKMLASRTLIFGNIFLPLTLFAAAAYHPLKYLMPIPAMSVFVGICTVVYGISRVGARTE